MSFKKELKEYIFFILFMQIYSIIAALIWVKFYVHISLLMGKISLVFNVKEKSIITFYVIIQLTIGYLIYMFIRKKLGKQS
jgi:membrane protein DedA with SNARE-associated domain